MFLQKSKRNCQVKFELYNKKTLDLKLIFVSKLFHLPLTSKPLVTSPAKFSSSKISLKTLVLARYLRQTDYWSQLRLIMHFSLDTCSVLLAMPVFVAIDFSAVRIGYKVQVTMLSFSCLVAILEKNRDLSLLPICLSSASLSYQSSLLIIQSTRRTGQINQFRFQIKKNRQAKKRNFKTALCVQRFRNIFLWWNKQPPLEPSIPIYASNFTSFN